MHEPESGDVKGNSAMVNMHCCCPFAVGTLKVQASLLNLCKNISISYKNCLVLR